MADTQPKRPSGAMDPLATRLSLIVRLKTTPCSGDWDLFFRQYANPIIAFSQKLGLDSHASQDVLQETMIVLMQKLPGFNYDPTTGRFRNWLLTITANKVRESRRRAHVGRLISLESAPRDGSNRWEESTPDDAPPVPEQVELIWRQSLLEEALRRVRLDPQTKPGTLDVFEAYVLKQKDVAEVAAEFNLSENTVYQIKNRITRRLREELVALGVLEDAADDA
jgi:RNA polymerase sigma factor (sigma-70 family)